jgi:multiple sugar transport system ATP-binding protein
MLTPWDPDQGLAGLTPCCANFVLFASSPLKLVVLENPRPLALLIWRAATVTLITDIRAVMRAGRIVQLGGPLEVYDHPADMFVGGFIGSPSMNFLDGTVVSGSEGTQLRIGDSMIEAPAGAPEGHARVGIRAEAIQLVDASIKGAILARIDVVEPLGSSILLTVEVGQHEIKVQVPADHPVQSGDEVHLRLAPESIRLYDPETGLGWDLR